MHNYTEIINSYLAAVTRDVLATIVYKIKELLYGDSPAPQKSVLFI